MPEDYEALTILLFLLPGFVGLLIYEITAEVPRRDLFDKVVVALALTVLASVIVSAVGGTTEINAILQSSERISLNAVLAGLGWTTATASGLGLVFAAVQNHGLFYRAIVKFGISKRTGAIDVWHQVFSRGESSWVRLRFKNGDVLIGWPKYFSEDTEKTALFLAKAVWHFVSPSGFVEEEIDGPGVLMTNFDDVIAIEQLR